MTRLTSWLVRLFAGASIAAISIVGTLAWVTISQRVKPEVPLTAGLAGEWTAVSSEFDKRVSNSFPVGSSEKQLATELQRQGFSRTDWDSLAEQEHEAVRREDDLVCRKAAQIYWRADGEGKLTTIRGAYREEGCL